MSGVTCASQKVTDADDEEDPRRGRGLRQGVLSESPVALAFGQNLQYSEDETQTGTADAECAEQRRLKGDHQVCGRVSVGTAEGLQPWGSHHGLV